MFIFLRNKDGIILSTSVPSSAHTRFLFGTTLVPLPERISSILSWEWHTSFLDGMAETVDLGHSDETNIRVYRKFMFLKSISTNLSLDSKSHWNFTTLIYHEYIIHRYYIVSVVRLYKQVPFKFVKTPLQAHRDMRSFIHPIRCYQCCEDKLVFRQWCLIVALHQIYLA